MLLRYPVCMCGRYTLVPGGAEGVPEAFDVHGPAPPPRWNLAPTQQAAVVRVGLDGRELSYLQWGLIPRWAKELSSARRSINARSETVAEKPSFRAAFQSRRCLVPASAWYEWTAPDGGPSRSKQAWLIWPDEAGSPDAAGLFAFAGIWESWGQGAEGLETLAILTMEARPEVAEIHERMPVIVRPDEYSAWLGESDGELGPIFGAVDRPELSARRVSSLVNSVAHEDSRCIAADAGLFV